tara:strand:+ start:284 stop:589 length:306 start_codon:yes stop_codon:yes gene_type:complete
MKTHNQPSYLFINEHDLTLHLNNSEPVIKINLYGENLEEDQLYPLYIKILKRSKLKVNQLDAVIRSIVKEHAAYALAYQCEYLNSMNFVKGVFKKQYTLSV